MRVQGLRFRIYGLGFSVYISWQILHDRTGSVHNPMATVLTPQHIIGSADNSFTIVLVARTTQSSSDTGEMGILRLAETLTSAGCYTY